MSIQRKKSIFFGIVLVIVLAGINVDATPQGGRRQRVPTAEGSVQQCAHEPNGSPCRRKCKKADCSTAQCCKGFCRRSSAYQKFCVKGKRNRANFCAGKRDEAPCPLGGCCQGICMTVQRFQAVCDLPFNLPLPRPIAPPQTQPLVPPQVRPIAPPQTQPLVPPQTRPIAPPQTRPIIDPPIDLPATQDGEWNYVDAP